jgi:glycosyltransferase involved in cell wall biosynthesis
VKDAKISIIIPSFNASATISGCLESLARQETSGPFEVIVVDSGSDDTAEIVSTQFPDVKLLRFEERKFAGDGRNLGIEEASGEILAFTDADCIAPPDWVETVALLHEVDHPVIGGAVENGNPESYLGWGYYFTEFIRWIPSGQARFVDDVPGCCWTMKRSIFEQYGPFITGTYCSDTAFHWKMKQGGLRPRFDPSLRVRHCNLEDIAEYASHEAFHGECFAHVRVREQRLTNQKIFYHVLVSPLLPFLLLARALLFLGNSPSVYPRFLICLPVVVLGYVGWSWGEFLGYLRELRSPSSRQE